MIETEGVVSGGFSEGEFRKRIESQSPLGRVGQPDDISPTAVYLASSDSKYLTGEILRLTGGILSLAGIAPTKRRTLEGGCWGRPEGTSQRGRWGAKVPKKPSEREHACIKGGLLTTRDQASAAEILSLGLSLQPLTVAP